MREKIGQGKDKNQKNYLFLEVLHFFAIFCKALYINQ